MHLRSYLKTALLAGTVAALVAAPTVASAQGLSGATLGMVSITAYGAKANDGVDDSAAIIRAINAAQARHAEVLVPAGTFQYDRLIDLKNSSLRGTGAKSILLATNPELQAIEISGRASSLTNLSLTTVPVDERLQTDESSRVLVLPTATGFLIKGVTIDGSSSAGIFNQGKRGVISGNTVSNTLADGIHLVNGTDDVAVLNNTLRSTGDDSISVVSYQDKGDRARGVVISGNDIRDGQARGITVSGGENITILKNSVTASAGAGIYVASEGNYRTYAVVNVLIDSNTITGDSANGSVAERGGIRLQGTNEDPSISRVVISRNTILNSTGNAINIVGSQGIQASFLSNTIKNPAGYGIRILSAVTGTLTFVNNKVTGSGQPAFSNASSATVTSDLPNDPNASGGGQGETAVAAHATPTIDGLVDASWAGATPLVMNTDADGTTGTARVMWDQDRLYFLFEMTDTTPNTLASDENNDSVEVWVDELNEKAGARGPGSYQLRVGRDNAISSSALEQPIDFSTVQSAVIDRPDGYTVEFSVPYTRLVPAAGLTIGFNASANDDSDGDGERNTYISWVDKDLPYYADTSAYGNVTLAQ